MDKSVPPPNEKTVIGGAVAEKFSSSEFQPLVHEPLNGLTIMNLCCFKIRDIAKWAGDNSILLKLDRMEKAVTEMATQLEGYSRASGGQKRRNPGQANPSSLQKRLSAFQTPEEMRKRCAGHVRPPRCDRCCAALSPRRAI